LFSTVGGYLTDWIRQKKLASTVVMRKVNSGLGLCVPGAFVVMAGYIGCNTTAAVAFFTISAAFNGLTGSKPYSV